MDRNKLQNLVSAKLRGLVVSRKNKIFDSASFHSLTCLFSFNSQCNPFIIYLSVIGFIAVNSLRIYFAWPPGLINLISNFRSSPVPIAVVSSLDTCGVSNLTVIKM